MRKEKTFMTADCETATLDFANKIANGDTERKKKIAIARPLIYDLGWVIANRKGEIIKRVQYLVAEIFCVPAIFNTAYYAEKRPLYLAMLERGETMIKPWREIMTEFVQDMGTVDAVGAYNSMFDFKKAIPFTELYINKLYSDNFYSWYNMQYKLCEKIADEPYIKDEEKEFDKDNFSFRGVNYPLFDIWGLAVIHLLDRVSYREECLKNGLLTNSGIYFKTSAESTYQYLCNKFDFVESHTALDDAIIETYILSKIAMRHKVETGIDYFPFRRLGYTDEFVLNRPRFNSEYAQVIIDKIEEYIDGKDEESKYIKGMLKRLNNLKEAVGVN